MKTKIQKIDSSHFSETELKEAIDLLKEGGLVAFPTETVYGLGADGLNALASEKIYTAKGRPSDNPLIVHIGKKEQLNGIVKNIPEKADLLAKAFWPGPLTMIYEKKDCVPFSTTGGLETVAVRMPSHPIARSLLLQSGIYIAAPSANRSGRPSPTDASHVIEDLNGRVEMILDGGNAGIGLESTIIDMTEETPIILRPGYITEQMVKQIIGEVVVDKAITSKEPFNQEITPKAPGMKYRHYAPKGALMIIEGTPKKVIESINRLAKEKLEAGYTVGILTTDEKKSYYCHGMVQSIGRKGDDEQIARSLYKALRNFDAYGTDYIYAENFGEKGLGQAIMNRLLKAAGYQIKYVG